MPLNIRIHDEDYTVDALHGRSIALPMTLPRAWYTNEVVQTPVRMGDWVGSVAEGGSVNFFDIDFNPHANGTHTECFGHISPEHHSMQGRLQRYWFHAILISINPKKMPNGDHVITLEQLEHALNGRKCEALIIRTLPNSEEKQTREYSRTNPAYMQPEAAQYLRLLDVQHLLIDTPSVDREEDGGALLAHRAFWNYPEAPRQQATITELIYVNSDIPDGPYLLNLQCAVFDNDAVPSNPVLYGLVS